MAEKDQGVKLEKHVTGIASFDINDRPYSAEIRPDRSIILRSVSPEIIQVADLAAFIERLKDVKRKIDNEMPAPPRKGDVVPREPGNE